MNPLICGVWLQGDVDIHPEGIWAAQFITKPRSRIESTTILMKGYEQHIRVMIEHILCPITMMDISIHYSNFG
jgi:hypothetical protein